MDQGHFRWLPRVLLFLVSGSALRKIFARTVSTLAAFRRDESAMSRMDCAVAQVPLIILIGVGTHFYSDYADKSETADAAMTVLGMPAIYIFYGFLLLWAVVIIVRAVRD
jgi:hypothetical protein